MVLEAQQASSSSVWEGPSPSVDCGREPVRRPKMMLKIDPGDPSSWEGRRARAPRPPEAEMRLPAVGSALTGSIELKDDPLAD